MELDNHQVDTALQLYTKVMYLYMCGYLYDIIKYKDTKGIK